MVSRHFAVLSGSGPRAPSWRILRQLDARGQIHKFVWYTILSIVYQTNL